jgi:AraC-like DNA-binding protein
MPADDPPVVPAGKTPGKAALRVARRLPNSTGNLARIAVAHAEAAGLEPQPLVKKAGLTVEQIEDRNLRLPVPNQIRLLELIAEALHDDLLGFHLACEFDLRQIGLLYYVLASSERLDDALQRVARYCRIANEGVLLKYIENSEAIIKFTYVGVPRHSDCHQIEFWFTAMVRSSRALTGRHIVPQRVRLTHHRHGDFSEFTAFLGCEIEFGAPVDEIVFDRAVKDLSVVGADPYLNDLLIDYCEEALARRAGHDGAVRTALQNVLAPLLPHGKAQVGEAARKLGMSPRTLARRLASEGLTFGRVLDELRGDLAQRHVTDSSLSMTEIAWLLGYQEVSAFTHAFKRWTGMTPTQLRAQVRSASSAGQT